MFYDVFIEFCKQKQVSPAAVAKEIGLSNSTTTTWKRGATPKINTIEKLAKYFDVSVGELLGYEDLGGGFYGKEASPEVYDKFLKNLAAHHPEFNLLPAEFNEFSRFIESLGYYIRLDGDRYQLLKGDKSVILSVDELKRLVRTSRNAVTSLVQDLIDNPPKNGAPDSPHKPKKKE